MAIPTEYRGIMFRSRLEARWAAFFDAIMWSYTYEPFDGDGYIPDFVIHGSRPLLVEVKPALHLADYYRPIEKVTSGVAKHWEHDLLIVGLTPTPTLPSSWDNFSAGLIGECVDIGEWEFGTARWVRCDNCGDIAVHHETLTYSCRPCGCGDGDRYLGRLNRAVIDTSWNTATTATQWQPR